MTGCIIRESGILILYASSCILFLIVKRPILTRLRDVSYNKVYPVLPIFLTSYIYILLSRLTGLCFLL